MFKKSLRISMIAAAWALAWGISGAAIGAIITVFQPDTGHIPPKMMPVLIGVPSAVFGLFSGLIYGALAVGYGLETGLDKRGRTVLGAGIGLVSGVVFMVVLAHSFVTILVAIIIGALLGSAFSRPGSDVK